MILRVSHEQLLFEAFRRAFQNGQIVFCGLQNADLEVLEAGDLNQLPLVSSREKASRGVRRPSKTAKSVFSESKTLICRFWMRGFGTRGDLWVSSEGHSAFQTFFQNLQISVLEAEKADLAVLAEGRQTPRLPAVPNSKPKSF